MTAWLINRHPAGTSPAAAGSFVKERSGCQSSIHGDKPRGVDIAAIAYDDGEPSGNLDFEATAAPSGA
jgi:hypothetical protein